MAEVIEKKTGDEPITLGGDPPEEPQAFDWATELPENMPEHLKSLKGKSFQDLADSQASLRKTLQERADKIKSLEDAAAAPPKEGDAPKGEIDPAIFHQAVAEYMETGEVAEGFLEQVQDRGVRVDRDTILRFFEWQSFERTNMIENLSKYTKGTASPEDVQKMFDWLKSGDSPFSKEEAAGFDAMYKKGNYAFMDTLSQEFSGAVEGGYKHSKFPGPRVRGKPIDTPEGGDFTNTEDFQQQLMAVRADGKLSPFERKSKEKALITRRRRQHGEI